MKLLLLRVLPIFMMLGFSASVTAQDLHYRLIDLMPTWSNPALTGGYLGTARIGGLYREQYRGFFIEPYQTPGAYIDAPLLYVGKKKKSWLGVGGTLIADKAGVAELSRTYAQASAAMHFILNERRSSRTVFSAGLMGGVLQTKADFSSDQIVLQEEQETSIGGGGLSALAGMDRRQNPSETGVDIALGVSLARKIDDERNFRVGATARHLIQPNTSLIRQDDKRNMTIGLQAAYRQLLDKKYLIEPAFYAQTTGGGLFEAQLQGMGGLLLGEDGSKTIKAGLGISLLNKFVYPMVGFEAGDFKFAASFDISTHGIQAAQDGTDEFFPTGFELGVQYIIKIYKQPKVEPVILCPQI